MFGGPARVAEITGADLSRVYRWTYPKSRGGTGGRVPERHEAALLAAAAREGIALTAEDFRPTAAPASAQPHSAPPGRPMRYGLGRIAALLGRFLP